MVLKFTYVMQQALAGSINLQGIPLRQTNFQGITTTSSYYRIFRTNIQDRFNFKLVHVLADGKCFFRTLSHIIFGDESEHNNVRVSLINTFEQCGYVPTLCCIQGYNQISIQEHFNEMKCNYKWEL